MNRRSIVVFAQGALGFGVMFAALVVAFFSMLKDRFAKRSTEKFYTHHGGDPYDPSVT